MRVIFRGINHYCLSYTSEEFTHYQELKEEVLLYEHRLKKRVGSFFLLIGFMIGLGLAVLSFLDAWAEGKGFGQWATSYNWLNLFVTSLFTTLLYYFVHSQKNMHRLINKKRELHNLLLDHPDLEKAAS